VRVNLPSPIQRIQVVICGVIPLISGLLNTITESILHLCLICSYPLHRSHLHPSSLSFSSITLPLLQNLKLSDPSLSLHGRIMGCHGVQHTLSTSIHRIQHLPKVVFLPFSFISNSWPLNVASASGMPPSTIDRYQTRSPLQLKGNVALSQSHSCKLTNWWKESQHMAYCALTASKYLSILARLWPLSASPHSLDHGLQVHLQTRTITASKLTQSRPPSA